MKITLILFICLFQFLGQLIEAKKRTLSSVPEPPHPKKMDFKIEKHGDVRIDPYYWMRERTSLEVLKHLKNENVYANEVLKPFKDLQKTIVKEIRSRVNEEDKSVPYVYGSFDYWHEQRTGKEYPLYFRRKVNSVKDKPAELLLDGNQLAKGQKYFSTSGPRISLNEKIMAYATDTKGRRIYSIYFKDLTTKKLLKNTISEVTDNFVWANDNDTIFYCKNHPETLRSYQLWKYQISTAQSELIYEEKDETFSLEVYKSHSKKYIFLDTASTLSSETLYLSANRPNDKLKVFSVRETDHLYGVLDAESGFLIRSNKNAKNYRILETPFDSTTFENWKELVPHSETKVISAFAVFKKFMALEVKSEALNHIRIITFGEPQKSYDLSFEDKAYSAGLSDNINYDTDFLRYYYETLKQPTSIYDYDVFKKQKIHLKTDFVPHFNADLYSTERLSVTARDGTKVPVSLVYRKDMVKNNTSPLLIYGYGSYGYPMDIYFSQSIFSLIDRGFIYAIAHVRGGGEFGRTWYDQGRTKNKMNTFFDFVDCTEFLIEHKYANPKRVFAMGESAGGLLMGAIANLRPDLYHGIIAGVPFVDVLTTMLDSTIPLTTAEYDEWGNPNVLADYEYIKKYSPYDNIQKLSYPNIFIRTGLNDSQVQYWEPAKWAAKLRDNNTGNSQILLKVNMDVGHGGASGRFEFIDQTAETYKFILSLVN